MTARPLTLDVQTLLRRMVEDPYAILHDIDRLDVECLIKIGESVEELVMRHRQALRTAQAAARVTTAPIVERGMFVSVLLES
jgi:hypothetical protein